MVWRKSSFSTTNGCVEVDMEWHKSSFSAATSCVEVGRPIKSSFSSAEGNCVEMEVLPDRWVGVRDTKDNGNGPVRKFSYEQWEEILDEILDNTFNWRTFAPLHFTTQERYAFIQGVQNHEFNFKESV